jgi:YD repeat-containing protein
MRQLRIATTTYDANGIIRTTSAAASAPATPASSRLPAAGHAYTPNNLNQYASVDGQSLGYDSNRNLTGDGVFSYAYDTENQVLSASATVTTATCAYDPQGRRKSKTVNDTTTRMAPAKASDATASGSVRRCAAWAMP